ncbi:MAG TPA: flagellar hook-associated family protein [Hyphomicrobium sp.]|nr:flagellar hook-associated family protein [Hyphomicrobium sp.]
MMLNSMPTLAATSAMLSSGIRRTQAEMTRIQSEVASGRLADTGLHIGSASATLVSFQQDLSVLQSAVDANSQLAGGLSASQDALASIVSNAQSVLKAAIAARGDPQARAVATQQARGALQSFTEAANTSYNGVYLFSGLNTQMPPFEAYFAVPPPASKASLEAAFFNAFGATLDDPAVDTISASSMQAFLDSAYQIEFNDTNWSSNWTSATVQGTTRRISMQRTAEIPVTGQAVAFRKIASSLALLSHIGAAALNDAAFDTIVSKASKELSEGIALMGGAQAALGVVQQQIAEASSDMQQRIELANTFVTQVENADLTGLSVRLNALMTQLEATYAVTGRLQKLSLLNAI